MAVVAAASFRLGFGDWRGYLVAFFATNWLANQWMSLYRRLRVDIKHEDLKAEVVKHEKKQKQKMSQHS